MWITTSFQSGETVSSGLSPTIRVRDVETGLVVASGTMDELGDGFYAYDFLEYDITREYAVLCDAVTLPNIDRYKSLATGEYGELISSLNIVTDEIDFRMNLVKKIWRNKLELSDGDTQNLVIYDDDGVTPLVTWDVTDVLDDVIEQIAHNTSDRTRGI